MKNFTVHPYCSLQGHDSLNFCLTSTKLHDFVNEVSGYNPAHKIGLFSLKNKQTTFKDKQQIVPFSSLHNGCFVHPYIKRVKRQTLTFRTPWVCEHPLARKAETTLRSISETNPFPL